MTQGKELLPRRAVAARLLAGAIAVAVAIGLPGCSDGGSGSANPVEQASKCITPGTNAKPPYLPASRPTLERCFKKVMGDEAARRFLLGAANTAVADWLIRYATELEGQLTSTGQFPAKAAAESPAIREGVAQLKELYQALLSGLRRHRSIETDRRLRSVVALVGWQTAAHLADPQALNLAAAGRSYVSDELGTRIDANFKILGDRLSGVGGSEKHDIYDDIVDGFGVALWHSNAVRANLTGATSSPPGTPFRDPIPPPPTATYAGQPIDPPLEAPGHLLRVPDLAASGRAEFDSWFFYGAHKQDPHGLVSAASNPLELAGLKQAFDEVFEVLDKP